MADNQNLQTTQVIAKIFGVSTRRIEQLKAEGVIKGQGQLSGQSVRKSVGVIPRDW